MNKKRRDQPTKKKTGKNYYNVLYDQVAVSVIKKSMMNEIKM